MNYVKILDVCGLAALASVIIYEEALLLSVSALWPVALVYAFKVFDLGSGGRMVALVMIPTIAFFTFWFVVLGDNALWAGIAVACSIRVAMLLWKDVRKDRVAQIQ